MRKRGFGRRTPAGLLSLPLLVAAVVVVVLSFGAGSALAAGSFTCSDNVGSDAGLQTLLDGGGTVTVNGICLGNYFVNTTVTIRGGGPGATLNGNATGSVLTFNGPYTLTVKSLTVTNGSSLDGGGINDNGYCGATTNLQNAQVWGNTASDDGGGFYTQCGTLNDPGSTIRNNYAGDEGGGIYSNGCGGTINVTNSTVSNNTAAFNGGGILVYCSEINLTGASISVNNAGDYGGGIAVYENSLLFATASTITQNSALSEDGGGIDANSSIVTLTNTEVGANTAQWYGGGINFGDPFLSQSRVEAERGAGRARAAGEPAGARSPVGGWGAAAAAADCVRRVGSGELDGRSQHRLEWCGWRHQQLRLPHRLAGDAERFVSVHESGGPRRPGHRLGRRRRRPTTAPTAVSQQRPA